jgi:glutamine amidotransferase-like uncharacterized protein
MRVARLLIGLVAPLVALAIAACSPAAPRAVPPVLIFAGTGTSSNDLRAVEAILHDRQLAYTTATSRELNAMSVSQLAEYKLMLVPGGDFMAVSKSLTSATAANVHTAVQNGLNYLGICAGAFLAARGTYTNFDLTSGVRFGFYAAERQGIRKSAVMIAGAGTAPIEHYWEDGPELSGWGTVVGTYPDGTPAIAQGASGKGWVILTGVHPEAPESWRRDMTFTAPARIANDYAATLIDAALHGTPLVHY